MGCSITLGEKNSGLYVLSTNDHFAKENTEAKGEKKSALFFFSLLSNCSTSSPKRQNFKLYQ